ncbi:MAG: hypothetical protein M1820_003473 [Bogoriella megaspora]|nr:MAG: hypothetical protein M1820_003473 [Bogoriella megaspora]
MNGFSSLPTPLSSPNLLSPTHVDGRLSPNSASNGTSTSNSWLAPPSDGETTPSRSASPGPDSENSGWSSAVGRATTGKSGRVIERLMAENDRLRRELRAELSRREELQRTVETNRPMMETLRAENQNLVAMRAADEGVLARRERKIEQLKGDLESERDRREGAERRANDMVRLKEEVETKTEREVGEANDKARYAMVQVEILQQSLKQLRVEYQQRAETLAKGIQEVTAQREDDLGKMARLDIVVEQMRQEVERANKTNDALKKFAEQQKSEFEKKIQEVANDAEQKDEEAKRLRDEMAEVIGKMKWVMNVQQNVGSRS